MESQDGDHKWLNDKFRDLCHDFNTKVEEELGTDGQTDRRRRSAELSADVAVPKAAHFACARTSRLRYPPGTRLPALPRRTAFTSF